VLRRVESRRFRGVREGEGRRRQRSPPYIGVMLSPWGTALWATTLGFMPPCPRGSRNLTQLSVAPPLTPCPTGHSGISRNFWFDHLFFENQSKINIKNKFSSCSLPVVWSGSCPELASALPPSEGASKAKTSRCTPQPRLLLRPRSAALSSSLPPVRSRPALVGSG
jgi:hypothetical protein